MNKSSLALAFVAVLLVAWFVVRKQQDELTTVASEQDQEAPELKVLPPHLLKHWQSLEERVTRLEAAVEANSTARSHANPTDSATNGSGIHQVAVQKITSLEGELQNLRQQVVDLEQDAIQTRASLSASHPPKRKLPNKERVVELRNAVSDRNAGDEERLRALKTLRFLPKELGPHDGLGRELVFWIEDVVDPEIREDIVRQLHGAHVPELVRPLLELLANDPSEGVRSEAAETLSDYLGEPGVREALERARDSDPSHEVRDEAGDTLVRGG